MILISPTVLPGFSTISAQLTSLYSKVAPAGSTPTGYTPETIYFIDNNGKTWKGGQIEYGDHQAANCNVPAGAVSAKLTMNVAVKPTGTGCASILSGEIITSKGTFTLLDTGGKCGVSILGGAQCSGVPTYAQTSYDISSMIDFNNDTQITMDLDGCSATELVSTNIEWLFYNVYVVFEVPAIENVGTVNISAIVAGAPTNGIDITLVDSSGNSTSATTGANGEPTGLAGFGQLNIGTYTIQAQYKNFAAINQSVTVVTGQNNFTITFKCQSGYTYCGGQCVQNCGTGSQLNTSTCQCENTTVSGVINPLVLLAGVIVLGVIGGEAGKTTYAYEKTKQYEAKGRMK